MKNSIIFFLIIILSPELTNAQSSSLSLGIGTGKFTIEEDIDPDVNINFGLPISLLSTYTYLNKKNYGMSLKLNYMESRVKGYNWLTNDTIDGYLNSTTFYTLLSKQWKKKMILYKIEYGPGFCIENYLLRQETQPKRSNYVNLLLNFTAKYPINENLTLGIEPNLIITDLVKGIGYLSGNWSGQSAGEDFSLIINMNLEFILKYAKN